MDDIVDGQLPVVGLGAGVRVVLVEKGAIPRDAIEIADGASFVQ